MNIATPVDTYPLSPMQQGMLLHYLRDSQAGTDIEQIVCELPEKIDSAALREAWVRVTIRHAVLRTVFQYQNGNEPLQAVLPDLAPEWKEQNWQKIQKGEVDDTLSAFLTADRHRPFDISEGPLQRLTLIRISDSDYRLVWTFHHILMDGRSFPLVLTEVFEIYESICEGREITLEPSRPYRDYIEWLQQQDNRHGDSYWKDQLSGFSSPTRLPFETVPTTQIDAMNRQGDAKVFLSAETTTTLLNFATEHGCTLNTLVQGAWALVLSGYTGEDNVLYGGVRAGRKSSTQGADNTVGLFMNTLPISVQINVGSTVANWLKQLRAQWVAMRDYEHTPLVQAQRFSAVPSGTRLFDSILMFDNYQLDEVLKSRGGKWQHRSFRLYEQTGYPITLTVYAGTALCLQIEFDRTQFAADVIEHMLGHVRTLLEAMPKCADSQLRELPMLTAEELHKITVQWNETEEDYPRHATVHQLFESQVKRSPDAVAVICKDQRLTYTELNRRANQLAALLRAKDVQADTLVALCVERSVEMLVAVLGILKSGAAYVPLDPAFPKERLALILQDSGATILLTQTEVRPGLPDFHGDVIEVEHADASACGDDIATDVGSGNLAYVIFTSGSTGRPKGVEIEHRSVVNFLESMRRQPGLGSEDTLLAVTTLSFDIAGLELFLPLVSGARVVIATREAVVDGRLLAELMHQHHPTIMQATPTTWRLMIESGWQGSKDLKSLCGGESFPRELAQQLLCRCSSLWNVYGPTETTIWSTVSQVLSADRAIPIGKPIANTQVFILDRELRPVPVGVTGELFIAGDGLARGYFHRPDLTADRFVPNPFGTSARMYKTGDLCRWSRDGSIECLGRNDYQVKIRGHRIELGDIETALATHPEVKQAVVTVQERDASDKRLVSYVVSTNGHTPTMEELRSYLAERLPDYMVPAVYVGIAAVPLTPNGKVDRKALPVVHEIPLERDLAWRPPQNATERIIATAWHEVLGVSNVGNDSNFFDLGGDSLLMIRVRAKLEQATHRNLPIIEMFRHPTVNSLANYMNGQETSNQVLSRSRKEIASIKESARRRLQVRKMRGSIQ